MYALPLSVFQVDFPTLNTTARRQGPAPVVTFDFNQSERGVLNNATSRA